MEPKRLATVMRGPPGLTRANFSNPTLAVGQRRSTRHERAAFAMLVVEETIMTNANEPNSRPMPASIRRQDLKDGGVLELYEDWIAPLEAVELFGHLLEEVEWQQ